MSKVYDTDGWDNGVLSVPAYGGGTTNYWSVTGWAKRGEYVGKTNEQKTLDETDAEDLLSADDVPVGGGDEGGFRNYWNRAYMPLANFTSVMEDERTVVIYLKRELYYPAPPGDPPLPAIRLANVPLKLNNYYNDKGVFEVSEFQGNIIINTVLGAPANPANKPLHLDIGVRRVNNYDQGIEYREFRAVRLHKRIGNPAFIPPPAPPPPPAP